MARRKRTTTRAVARRRYWPRRNNPGRGGGRGKLSLAMLVSLVPLGKYTMDGYGTTQSLNSAIHNLVHGLTGYEWVAGRWQPNVAFQKCWMPVTIGMIIHWCANRFGVNRMIPIRWLAI